MKKFESSVLAVAAAMVLGACSSTPVDTGSSAAKPAAQPAMPTTQGKTSPATTGAAPAAGVTSAALPAHKDAKSAIAQERSVFFEYDDFSIGNAYQNVIINHGKYLQANPKFVVRIEGHADERGSAEYNLALGQRRAESVMRALKLYGVKEAQMEAVSFGEERPRTRGQDESAWSQNRRADITYRD